MFGVLLLCFSLMVFVTLLFLSMCKQIIYGIILLLQNPMCFLYSNVFKCLLSVSFPAKLNLFKLIGGGEYRKLNSFFQTIGIHHRLIYPYTHEQNGIIERHHRYIVETGLTLLG
jgi:hypothetical protein